MTQSSEHRMAILLQQLQMDPTLATQLPQWENDIVQRALAGEEIYEIAQHVQMTESAVWEVLGNAARMAVGKAVHPTEIGGLGSDTDPGVTGGYDETNFGRLPYDAPPTPAEE